MSQGRRFYLDHMIRLGIPLDKEWTGDVRDFCTVDDIIYPHLILSCVHKFKSSQFVEHEVQSMYDKLTAIQSMTVFDRELADLQDKLDKYLRELEHSTLKPTRVTQQNTFSVSRCDEICDKLRDGGTLTDAEFGFIQRHAWAFKWTFRGTPEQEEQALGVRFSCSDLGE